MAHRTRRHIGFCYRRFCYGVLVAPIDASVAAWHGAAELRQKRSFLVIGRSKPQNRDVRSPRSTAIRSGYLTERLRSPARLTVKCPNEYHTGQGEY